MHSPLRNPSLNFATHIFSPCVEKKEQIEKAEEQDRLKKEAEEKMLREQEKNVTVDSNGTQEEDLETFHEVVTDMFIFSLSISILLQKILNYSHSPVSCAILVFHLFFLKFLKMC